MSDETERAKECRSGPRKQWGLAVVAVFGVLVSTLGACEDPAGQTADFVFPPSQEEKLGERMEKQVACDPQFELYEGKKVRDYVKSLGKGIVEAAGDETPEGIEYEFHVIDDDETVNAFAMPGGEIYFYTGLLLEAGSTAEVAGVMAHEVAHVTERHIAERLVAQTGLQVLLAAALGQDPSTVAQLVGILGANGALLRYSRTHESESDEVGLAYMIDAGWDPQGMISFFETLEEQGGGRLPTILSSHPNPGDRIEALQKQLDGRDFPGAAVGEQRHQSIVEIIENNSDELDPSFSRPENCREILKDAGYTDVELDAGQEDAAQGGDTQ